MQITVFISLLFILFKYSESSTIADTKLFLNNITTNASVTVKEFEKQVEVLVNSLSKMALKYFARNSDLNVSSQCKLTFVKMFLDLRKWKIPVIKLLDSMPKPPYGLLKGVLSIMGDYDECLEVKANEKGDIALTDTEEVYHGQYCMVEAELPPSIINGYIDYRNKRTNISAFGKIGKFYDEFSITNFANDDAKLKVGICMPSTCSAKDLQTLLSFVPLSFHSMRVKYCDDGRFQQLDVGQITFIVFLVSLGTCVISGTVLEMCHTSKSTASKGNKNKLLQLLMAFSIFNNSRKLVKLEKNSADSQIPAINGMYVIGSLFVIIYHTYFVPFFTSYSGHMEYLLKSMGDWKFTIMTTMGISIDCYFLFSGIFMIYPRYRREGKQMKIDVFQIIIRRYLRFCPSMLVILGIIVSLPLIGSGPVWSEIFGVAARNTRRWWWTYVLMFNNFLTVKDQSFFPLWFIPCLMQITVVGTILLRFISKNPKLGICLTIVTCLCCNIALGILTLLRNYPLTYALYYYKNRDYYERTIYTSSLSHMSSYGIGLLLGYFMAKNPALKLSKNQVMLGWIVSSFFIAGTHFFCYLGHEGQDLDPIVTAVYAATHRILYTLGMSWMVLACKYGYGGVLGEFLSWNGFGVMAKLSYSGYLLHYIVIAYHISSTRVPMMFSHYEIFIRFCGYATLTLLASYFFYITFELPMTYVESLLLRRRSDSDTHGNISNQTNGKCNENSSIKENGALHPDLPKLAMWEELKLPTVEESKL